MILSQILVPQLKYLVILWSFALGTNGYFNRYSMPEFWANFILKLKYVLFISLEIEIAVKSWGTVRKLRK